MRRPAPPIQRLTLFPRVLRHICPTSCVRTNRNAAYRRLAKIVESDHDKVALAAIKVVIDAEDQLLSTTVAPNHDAPEIAPTTEFKPGADPRSKELSSSPAEQWEVAPRLRTRSRPNQALARPRTRQQRRIRSAFELASRGRAEQRTSEVT